jgi:hypothetical protein
MPCERGRLDPALLDPDDPFEVDHQLAHLYKHETFGLDDAYDVFASDPVFFPATADGPADWLMVAEVPGHDVLIVPLAPSRRGDPHRARPVGVYRAGESLKQRYRDER